MGQETRYKLAKNRGIWGAREIGGARKWTSLGTRDKKLADLKFKKLYGETDMPEQSLEHYEMAKAHLAIANPEITNYTFDQLYRKWYGIKGIAESTKERRKNEVGRNVFATIKDHKLCDPKAKAIIEASVPDLGIFARESLGELQRLALKLGWALMPFVTPALIAVNPSERRKTRAITPEEHQALVSHERASAGRPNAKDGLERANYYELLYLTGAAQTDGAMLTASNIDWDERELVFYRQKTKERCAIQIVPDTQLERLLKSLPNEGWLFPHICTLSQRKRGRDFRRHVKRLGLHEGEEKLSLHSYRYHMAEWCAEVGMPIRDAQTILGHASKAVAHAYAKKAKVSAVTPEAYVKAPAAVIDGTRLVA